MKEELLIADGPEAVELLKQLKKEQAAKEAEERKKENARIKASYDERVKAVLETAWAYYRKGPAIQYDSLELARVGSRNGEPGSRRTKDYASPESYTMDEPGYMVCSTFPFNVYYETIGLELCGHVDRSNCKGLMGLTDGTIVYHWKESDGETIQEAVEILKAVLRPGDIFASTKGTDHALLYMGDIYGDGVPYFMHSWGAKYNMNTGKDSYETMGTLRLQTMEEVCLAHGNNDWYKSNKIPRWCVWGGMSRFAVIRPLRVYRQEDHPLTDNAKARLNMPGLNIDRRCSHNFYTGAAAGEKLTYTVTVENTSCNTYEVPVAEQLPEGTELISGQLSCRMVLQPGQKQQLTYTVLVLPTTQRVVSGGGFVAGIRSNTLVTPIRKHLTPQQEQKLQSFDYAGLDGMELANRVYGEALAMNLPKLELHTLFRTLEEGLIRRTDVPIPMLVEKYIGGRSLIHEKNRILEFPEEYLRIGDVLLYVTEPLTANEKQECFIYLGQGRYGCAQGIIEESPLWNAFQKDLFLCLRPGQL